MSDGRNNRGGNGNGGNGNKDDVNRSRRGDDPFRLVRVSGEGDYKKKYDSFGHEIKEEKPVVNNTTDNKRLQGGQSAQRQLRHSELVKETMEQEQELPRQTKPQTSTRRKPDERVVKDKERAYQLRLEHKRKRRKQTMLAILRVTTVLMCVAMLIFVIIFSGQMRRRVNTQYVKTGAIDNAISGDISFLRNELGVAAEHSGKFVAYVNEGDRVSGGGLIGYVVSSGYEEEVRKLKSVESKITAAQRASSYISTNKTPELLAVEDAVATAVEQMSAMAMSGDMRAYHEQIISLRELFTQKNELVMSVESGDSYLTSLQEERTEILSRVSSYMHEVTAPNAGIVSFSADGNESQVSSAFNALDARVAQTNFTSVSSSTIPATEIQTYSLQSGQYGNNDGQIGDEVTSGSIVARISPDITYYVTMAVDNIDGLVINPGSDVTVRSNVGDMSFTATLSGVLYADNTKLIVLKSTSALTRTVSERIVGGEFIFTHTEGLKVPLRALTEWDDAGVTARITIVRSGYVEYVYVNVLAKDNDYAIINSRSSLDDSTGVSVRENDEYVVEYEKVEEGQAL